MRHVIKKRLIPLILILALALAVACAPTPIRTDPEPAPPPKPYPQPQPQPPYSQPQPYPSQPPYGQPQPYPGQPPYSQTQPPYSPSQPYPPGPPPGDFGRATIERQMEIRKATAQGLRLEAYGLQQKKLFREAVSKYRESLAYWPDPSLEAYIGTIENTMKLPSSQIFRPSTGQGMIMGQPYTMMATFRNRSNSEVSLRLSEGRGTPDVTFLPGEILELALTTNPGGEITVSVLQAGRLVAMKRWIRLPGDPSAVPAIIYDDKEPERLLIMTAIKTR